MFLPFLRRETASDMQACMDTADHCFPLMRGEGEGAQVRAGVRTCQTKSSGALESRTEGRKRAMWKVGSATVTRFRLTSSHTGASGRICARTQKCSKCEPV